MSEEILFSPVKAYMSHFLSHSMVHMKPPKDAIFLNKIGVHDGQFVVSVILDRQGQFQTELFIAPPTTKEVSSHSHIGVDSIELCVAGDFIFKINGENNINVSSGQRIGENFPIDVPEDRPHAAVVKKGASFLSFQFWKDGTTPTTIGDKFEILGG